eukprot:TRINITY_DN5851_c1_g1_i1.p1 TRINITY_DN5851_c1_g1~~TRINITY_DN5851_c1_g1_i1.p1  ORF type:complete len:367 (-),score=27.02 TRINITY_DN5851_c1_g1_i1:782-1882(-)
MAVYSHTFDTTGQVLWGRRKSVLPHVCFGCMRPSTFCGFAMILVGLVMLVASAAAFCRQPSGDGDDAPDVTLRRYAAAVASDLEPLLGLPEASARNLTSLALQSPLAGTWSTRKYVMRSALDIPIPASKGCGPPYRANVYYPEFADGGWEPVPLISWAHGWLLGGKLLDKSQYSNRDVIIQPLVTQGYLVVAYQCGGALGLCTDPRDQLRMLDWIRASRFAERIDPSATVVAGFSLGGAATLRAAANRDAVAKHNIRAALAVNPYCVGGCSHPVVPTFFVGGSVDIVAPQGLTFKTCRETRGVPRYFAKYKTAHIITVWQGRHMVTPPLVKMLSCYVRDDDEACFQLNHIGRRSLPDLLEFYHFPE